MGAERGRPQFLLPYDEDRGAVCSIYARTPDKCPRVTHCFQTLAALVTRADVTCEITNRKEYQDAEHDLVDYLEDITRRPTMRRYKNR